MDFFSFDYNPNLRFDMFTGMHLFQVLLFMGVIGLFFLLKDKVYNSKYEKQIRYSLASFLIINLLILIIIEASVGIVFLPFHLCSISYILTIILLFTNNEKIYIFIFFTGILGGIVSILIPEFGNGGYDRFIFYEFIIAHSAIIYVPIYYLTNYKYKIDFKRCYSALIIANIFGFSMFLVNYILRVTNIEPEANYMFTQGPPPEVESIFGVFPWHIFSFEAVLIISSFFLYLAGSKYTKKYITNKK